MFAWMVEISLLMNQFQISPRITSHETGAFSESCEFSHKGEWRQVSSLTHTSHDSYIWWIMWIHPRGGRRLRIFIHGTEELSLDKKHPNSWDESHRTSAMIQYLIHSRIAKESCLCLASLKFLRVQTASVANRQISNLWFAKDCNDSVLNSSSLTKNHACVHILRFPKNLNL